MRGILIAGLLIAMLIIGILVVKNIESGPKNTKKTDAIDRAKKVKKTSEQMAQKIRDAMGKTGNALSDTP